MAGGRTRQNHYTAHSDALGSYLLLEQVNTRFSKVKDQREEDGVADNFNTVPATLNTVPQKE